MNDWWNDPPEEPEYDPSIVSSSEIYDTLNEYHMDDPPVEYEPEPPPLCPHGNEWAACDHCDFLGDIAYDSWREKH